MAAGSILCPASHAFLSNIGEYMLGVCLPRSTEKVTCTYVLYMSCGLRKQRCQRGQRVQLGGRAPRLKSADAWAHVSVPIRADCNKQASAG